MCRRFESSRGRQNRRSSVSVPADLHRISTRLLVPRRLLDQRDPGSRWSRGAPLFRWSSSAPRGTSRARVETPTKPLRTVAGSRHASSFLVGYSINGTRVPAGRVVPRDEGAGHVSRPQPSPRRPSPDLDTAARPSRPTRSTDAWVPAGRGAPCCSAGRVVPREERAGHVSRPQPSPRRPSPDLDTAARPSRPTRSTDAWVPAGRGAPCCSAGRVVPREERAGHVSRPQASPSRPSPDLDTPPRSSSATRPAVALFRWSSSAPYSRWSSSAPRGTSRARVETSTKSPQTLTGSRHASSFLVGYSINGTRVPAGRVVPRDERAGHVSRPQPSP